MTTADRATVADRVGTAIRRRDCAWWASRLHYLSLATGLAILVWVDRHQWFAGDEWDLLIKRGITGHHQFGLFEPHNEHWVTGPILIYRALFSIFGVRTYLPYLLVLFAFQLLVTHLLWRLMLRVGVLPMVATAAAAVFVVLGAGWEELINAFQMTFVAPLAFGLGALLLQPTTGRFGRRDAYGWGLNVLALTFSGVGITMLVITAASALLRRGWRVALAVASVPAVVYLLWYAKWGRHAQAIDQEPLRTSLQKSPGFVWRGLVDAVDGTTGLTGVGAVVLVLLVVWLIRRTELTTEPWPMVLTTAVGAPLFLFLIDIRRSGLGVAAAGAPRYVYVVVALLLPAAALAVSSVLTGRSLAWPVGIVGTALLLLVSLTALHTNAVDYALIKQENRARIVAAAALVRSDAPLVGDQPAPEFDPDITVALLRQLDRDGALPDVTVDEVDRLTAREFLQIAGGPGAGAAKGATARPSVEGADHATTAPDADDPACVTVTPTGAAPVVFLSFPDTGFVVVRPTHEGVITAQLQVPGEELRGRGRAWNAAAGQDVVLSVSATDQWVRLGVPADGTTRLCHVQS